MNDVGSHDAGPAIAGHLVGRLGFGCWRLVGDDVAGATATLEAAIDAYTSDGQRLLVDTADVYGLDWGGLGFGSNEVLLGRVLAAAPDLASRIVLATKGGIDPPTPYDGRLDSLITACDASLRRLRVERIDLYQLHRPDLFAHPAEVAEALERLHRAGKIDAVGVSNVTPSQHRALAAHLSIPIRTTQPEFSLLHRNPLHDGTFDLAMETGTLPLVWSPLAGGRLVGDSRSPELGSVIDELASAHAVDRSAIAIAWVLAHPAGPVALLGSQSPDRMRAAAVALGVRLEHADLYRLLTAAQGAPMP